MAFKRSTSAFKTSRSRSRSARFCSFRSTILFIFDTNALTGRILHENGKMIQGRGWQRSRFSSRCAHLARGSAGLVEKASAEEPLALLVDELAPLGDGGVDGGLLAGEAVGADEGMLLTTIAGGSRDGSGKLILAIFQERLRGDQVPLVLDLLGRRGGVILARLSPTEQGFQKRHLT